MITIVLISLYNYLQMQTRWAWGTEEPSQLERQVAPRQAPSFCMLRCAVLICVTWCLLACITVSCTLLPVVLGRIAHLVTQLVPAGLTHDPACYLVGLMILAPLIELVLHTYIIAMKFCIYSDSCLLTRWWSWATEWWCKQRSGCSNSNRSAVVVAITSPPIGSSRLLDSNSIRGSKTWLICSAMRGLLFRWQ